MKYICINPKCGNYNIVEERNTESFVFRNGALVGRNCACPKCGELRKEVNPDAEIPLSEKNIDISFYSGMSMEQKRAVLKKRSHEHFKKEIKERKDGLLDKAMTEMRNIKTGK